MQEIVLRDSMEEKEKQFQKRLLHYKFDSQNTTLQLLTLGHLERELHPHQTRLQQYIKPWRAATPPQKFLSCNITNLIGALCRIHNKTLSTNQNSCSLHSLLLGYIWVKKCCLGKASLLNLRCGEWPVQVVLRKAVLSCIIFRPTQLILLTTRERWWWSG